MTLLPDRKDAGHAVVAVHWAVRGPREAVGEEDQHHPGGDGRVAQVPAGVGPARYCSPRHLCLELHGIL